MIGSLLLAALLAADTATAPPRILDRVAGTVNGEVITMAEVQERAAVELRRMEMQPASPGRDRARGKTLKLAFDNLVAERLFASQVSSLGIEVNDSEIDSVVEDTKRRYGLTDEVLDQALKQQGMDRAAYRKAVKRDIESVRLMQMKVRSRVKVTDEDVKNYYQTHPGEFRASEEVRARHILIATPGGASADQDAKARALAEKALQRVRAGEDFGAVAKQVSQGPSAADGGELGWLRRGTVQEDIERAAFALQPGQVSDPIRTRTGYQLIQVEERRGGGVRPLDEVKDEIKDRLVNDQADSYRTQFIAELRKDAVIETKLPELKD
jgi:peptidyl-prolyl cis-trans isomerase SurA